MQERNDKSGTPAARVPLGATKQPRVMPAAKPDKFPKTPAEWKAFAALPSVDRAAVYLRSIRAMMLFFVVLTVIGIIAGVILALVGINAASDTTSVNTNPFG